MGTTADKLAYLADTKTAIKDAIVAKGVEIPDGTPFRQYADKVVGIPSGSETVSGNFLNSLAEFYYFDGDSAQKTNGSLFESKDVAKGSIVFITMGREPVSFTCSGGNLLFELDTTDIKYCHIRVVEVLEDGFSIGFM